MYHGSLSSIRIGTEAVAYGTEAATLVVAPGISSGLKFVENRQKPPTLQGAAGLTPSTGARLTGHVEGPMEFAVVRSRANIGPLYIAAGGELTSQVYTFGLTTVHQATAALSMTAETVMAHEDAASLSTLSYTWLGLVARSIQWNLNGGAQYATVSGDFIGRGHTTTGIPTKGTEALQTPIEQANLVHTGGLSVVTGETLGQLKQAVIRFERPVSGMERQLFGTTVLATPYFNGDIPKITATFTVDFDANTVTALDKFLADTALTSPLTCGDFAFTGAICVGDIPDLKAGPMEATFSIEATGLALTTVE